MKDVIRCDVSHSWQTYILAGSHRIHSLCCSISFSVLIFCCCCYFCFIRSSLIRNVRSCRFLTCLTDEKRERKKSATIDKINNNRNRKQKKFSEFTEKVLTQVKRTGAIVCYIEEWRKKKSTFEKSHEYIDFVWLWVRAIVQKKITRMCMHSLPAKTVLLLAFSHIFLLFFSCWVLIKWQYGDECTTYKENISSEVLKVRKSRGKSNSIPIINFNSVQSRPAIDYPGKIHLCMRYLISLESAQKLCHRVRKKYWRVFSDRKSQSEYYGQISW